MQSCHQPQAVSLTTYSLRLCRWYAIAFVGFLAFAIAAVQVRPFCSGNDRIIANSPSFLLFLQAYPTDLPVWALLIALVIPAVYVIPAGYVFALSGQPVSSLLSTVGPSQLRRLTSRHAFQTAMSNTICQILAGLLFPGQGIPNMVRPPSPPQMSQTLTSQLGICRSSRPTRSRRCTSPVSTRLP